MSSLKLVIPSQNQPFVLKILEFKFNWTSTKIPPTVMNPIFFVRKHLKVQYSHNSVVPA